MGESIKAGCGAPKAPSARVSEPEQPIVSVKENNDMIKVGKPAPEFELQGYHKGEFKQFKLSEFQGRWLLLCFYPGDFTFV